MRIFLVSILVGITLLAAQLPALAQSCRVKAVQHSQSVAGAKILDVKQRKGNNGEIECVAKFRVQERKDQAPRIITRRFKP